MENVDLCVCFGDVVLEGTMVCFKCQNRYKDIADKSPAEFMEECYGIKLHWYQICSSALLKFPERVNINIFFRTKGVFK